MERLAAARSHRRPQAPSAVQAGLHRTSGVAYMPGFPCRRPACPLPSDNMQHVGVERPQEGPGGKELCLWCAQPPQPHQTPVSSQRHGPSRKQTDNQVHCSENTRFKEGFHSNTVYTLPLGWKVWVLNPVILTSFMDCP